MNVSVGRDDLIPPSILPPHLLPFRRGRCPRSEASTLGVHRPAVSPPHPLPFRRGRCPHRPAVSPPHPLRCSVGADDPVRPNTAQRCHSEPVLAAKQVPLGCTLAWESVPLFMSSSGPWPPPTFAASRQRRDLIIAHPPGVRFPKGRGATPPFWSFQGEGIFKGRGKSKSLSP